jgi:hypothetical protein
MEYLHDLKATDVETSAPPGSFTAIVSTYEPYRVGDQVRPGAFRRSLGRWRRSGKRIPVLADHHSKIDGVIRTG